MSNINKMDKETLKKEIDSLLVASDAIRTQRNILEEKYEELYKVPELKKMIGTCYKYHNSYGGGSERWWLYTKIVGMKDSSFVTEEFQIDCHGKLSLSYDLRSNYGNNNYFGSSLGYINIKPAEYNAAKSKVKKYLAQEGF